MAQADGVVSNASGAAVRADLNNQLAAVFTNHSGSTEPTTTYPYQWWADTTTGLLKIRNAANSAWVTVGTMADVNLGLLAASGGTLTGALLAAAGSASTPSIAFSGDTNTGIYSPGADQVAISTGGSGRVFVDSSGRVGVGVSGPSYLIDASTATGTTTVGDGTVLRLVSSTTNGDCNIRFGSGTNATARLGVNGTDFYAYVNGAERMRLTSTGLGINTTSPGTTLDVVGAIRSQNSTTGGGILDAVYSGTSTGNQLGAVRFYGTGAGVTGESAIRSSLDSGVLTASNLTFSVSSGGSLSEAVRIDSSRRLLVGTSSSRSVAALSSQLQIESAVSFNGASFAIVNNSNDATGSYIALGKSRSGALGGVTSVQNGDLVGEVRFAAADGTDLESMSGQIQCFIDGAPGSNDTPGRLVFSTCPDSSATPVERMRIDNQGQLLTFFASGSNGMTARSASAAGTTYFLYRGMNSGTDNTTGGNNVFYVYTNGNVQNTNNSYAGISDIKLKENVVDATSQWSDIKALQVRKYNFKEETGQQTHTQIGLIAQEVELVSPGLVSESPDRDKDGSDLGTTTKSVNYSVLYMKAVKALQEAMERIEQLEAEMVSVKAQLS